MHSSWGKHNDLEDVGRDTYHHTFVPGNGLGDYFGGAIEWAWELLTEVWGRHLSVLRLGVRRYKADGLPADEEVAELWRRLFQKIASRGSTKDNFWEMGATARGPCSEIHFDGTPDGTGASRCG